MFFYLGNKPDSRFSHHYTLPNQLVLSTDSGWHTINVQGRQILYKGYHTEKCGWQDIATEMIKDSTPRFKGNFAMVIADSQLSRIRHGRDRSFPLYVGGSDVCNLIGDEFVGADHVIDVPANSEVIKHKIKPDTVCPELDHQSGIKRLHDIFNETTERFLSNNNFPLKIFLSGGIDTLTCYSYIKKFTNKFELVDYEFKKFTSFYRKNWHSRLRHLWGYQNCHSWGTEPTSLATGGCGDEYSLRGPTTANIMLMHHGVDVFELFQQQPNSYHAWYFMKDKNREIYQKQKNDEFLQKILKNKKATQIHVLNLLANDHQHWHLDATLFFTPFQNLDIIKTILGMPKQSIVDQVADASINKELISLNDPNDLKLLCDRKNYEPLNT